MMAPDHIVKLAGPFAAYSKFTDLPRAMRASGAKVWAAVELWQWRAASTHVGQDRLANRRNFTKINFLFLYQVFFERG